ncbi:lamin tail domain-containing protein 1-like [Watersipora subatra]|uniref:lamin tail domain-containing protein 1-like n=1 Tax=Watersipora subatra TaxID=2589382 RepID=UPI00355BA05C
MFKVKERGNNSHLTSLTRNGVHFNKNCPAKSSLGGLTIHEISPDGRYIMLHNTSSTDMEFGGYSIKQNICGVPATEFTFPHRMTFRGGAFVSVFAGVCAASLHQPPEQFVNSEGERWAFGPQVTTVLCNSSGKAVAWINATHRQNTAGCTDPNPNTIQTIPVRPSVSSEAASSDCLQAIGLNSEFSDQAAREDAQVSALQGLKRRPNTATPICKSPVQRGCHSASGQRMGSAPMRRYAPSIKITQ